MTKRFAALSLVSAMAMLCAPYGGELPVLPARDERPRPVSGSHTPAPPRKHPDHLGDESIANLDAAQAKRDRKNAKRLREARP